VGIRETGAVYIVFRKGQLERAGFFVLKHGILILKKGFTSLSR